MLVNVLNEKKRKKNHAPSIPCIHFVLNSPGSRSIKKIIIKNVSDVPRKKEANKKTRKPLSLNPLKSCSEAIPKETRINKVNKRKE